MAEQPKRPAGFKYSELYVEKGERLRDSDTLRVRLGAYIIQHLSYADGTIYGTLRQELGKAVPDNFAGNGITRFFTEAPLVALLNGVTVVRDAIYSKATSGDYKDRVFFDDARSWIEFCQRAFKEENVAWEVDAQGGVHPLVDAEFSGAIQSTIAGLSDERLVPVKLLVEQTIESLNERPPATRNAVADVFSAVESAFKIVTDSRDSANISAPSARQKLTPLIEKALHGDRVAQAAGTELLESLCAWFPAAHQYRHGQKGGPPNPPWELTVHLVSSGFTWIRWLAEFLPRKSDSTAKFPTI
jgi:hypothetical protein